MSHLSPIPGGLRPGLSIRVRGSPLPGGDRFAINLQTGPSPNPDQIPLHFSVRLNQGYIARNTLRHGNWDQEIGGGTLPIQRHQPFDIVITVEPQRYIINVNGQYFCEYPHRIPYNQVDHIHVHGDVKVHGVTFESRGPGFGGYHSSVQHTTYRNF